MCLGRILCRDLPHVGVERKGPEPPVRDVDGGDVRHAVLVPEVRGVKILIRHVPSVSAFPAANRVPGGGRRGPHSRRLSRMQTTAQAPVSRAAAALAELVRFRTVSSRLDHEVDTAEFEGFIAALARLYPPSTPPWTSNASTAARCCSAGPAPDRTPLRVRRC